VWINSTVTTAKLTIFVQNILHLIVFKLEAVRYDIELIELKERRLWSDTLQPNQTEWLFFTMETFNPEVKKDFNVAFPS
jgi:hypothetical protein